MLASQAEIELGLSLAINNGSQIRYVSFTNINKMINNVLTLLFYGGGEFKYPLPPNHKG